MILYIQEKGDSTVVEAFSHHDPLYTLNSKLDKGEAKKFKEKLQQLRKEHDFEDIWMLSFVLMMADKNNRENLHHLKKVVNKILAAIKSPYPKQVDLLFVLSIFKYFGKKRNVSESYCQHYLGSHSSRLSPLTRMLIREKALPVKGHMQGIRVWEISHAPVAFQLIEQILSLKEKSLYQMVDSVLSEDLVEWGTYQKKMWHDVKMLLTERSNKDFSSLITRLNENSYEESIKILKKGYGLLSKVQYSESCFVAQTVSRALYILQKDFDEAENWAQIAVEEGGRNFALMDTKGQVYKSKLLHLISDYTSPADMPEIMAVARFAIESFTEAQRLFENYRSTTSQDCSDDEYFSDDERDMSNCLPSYFGEVTVYLSIAKLMLSRYENNPEAKRKLREYMQNLDVEVGYLTGPLGIDLRDNSFLRDIYKRTLECRSYIMSQLELKVKEGERSSQKVSRNNFIADGENFAKAFLESSYDSLIKKLRGTTMSPELKVSLAQRWLRLHGLESAYIVLELKKHSYDAALQIVSELHQACQNSDLSLSLQDKICLLNVSFWHPARSEALSFARCAKLSHDATLTNEDLKEAYFWYLVCHLRNDEGLPESKFYDEETIARCVERLQEIRDKESSRAKVGRRDTTRRYNEHRILCYLAKDGRGFGRVTRPKNLREDSNEDPDRQRLRGIVRDNKYVTYTLPKGGKVKFRMAKLDFASGSEVVQVEFDLGFSLEGPIAINIKKVSRP